MVDHAIRLRLTAAIGLLTLLQGCGGPVTPATFVATAPVGVAGTDGVSGEYRLGPGDVLEISVFQVPDLTKQVQVDANGKITLALIGEMPAAGQTVHGLETEIAAKLRAKYLQSPQVSVYLRTAAGQKVTVTGSVNRPGVYPIEGQLTLVQALALSGDVDQVGDTSAINVFRRANGSQTVAKFNVDDIRAGKAADPNLYPGDMVVVDSSGPRVAWKNTKDILSPVLGTAGTAGMLVK